MDLELLNYTNRDKSYPKNKLLRKVFVNILSVLLSRQILDKLFQSLEPILTTKFLRILVLHGKI